MAKTDKRKFGDYGEKVAEHFLIEKGYQLIDRNYQKPWGEVDLVFKHNDSLVFCEVKTRDSKNTHDFLPEYSINYKKIRNLGKICETYMSERKYPENQPWRIDVVSVIIDKFDKKAKINHFENAIWDMRG